MESYRKVSVEKYVKELLESGIQPFKAEKFGRIHARVGKVGEEIITWTTDSEGKELIEREAQVKIDETNGKPGYVVTKVDESGMPVIDQNGHTNTWIIEASKFEKRYMTDEEMGMNIYKSSAGVQVFIQIQENIEMEQWGKLEKIAVGGYINITNVNDMYGISKKDYVDTYREVEEIEKTKKLS